jgi:hypothetical protein
MARLQNFGGDTMPRVALWFFAVAPVYVLIGMCLGIYMGASEDHSLYPAHAHLNLIGWATMALYGTFYALARDASRKLAWATFWLNNIGIVILFPSLAMVLKFGELPPYLIPLAISEFLVLGAVVCFTASVWGVLLRSRQSDTRIASGFSVEPAE